MDNTPITLYRQGNTNSPRMDNVRPDKDIACYDRDGRVWVMTTLANGESTGGISTFANPGYGKKLVAITSRNKNTRTARIS